MSEARRLLERLREVHESRGGACVICCVPWPCQDVVDVRDYLAQPMTKCEEREGELVAALEAVQGDVSYFELEDETQDRVDAALGEKA